MFDSKIHQLFAFVAIGPDGSEGVVYSNITCRLLIAWNLEGVDELRGEAQAVALENSCTVQLRKFSSMELLEVIGG